MMFGGKVKVDKLGKEFYKASEKNDVEKMKQIIESGLDQRALQRARLAFKGQLEVVKMLLDKGCPVDIRNAQKETALTLAVMYNRAETVKYLLEKGANPRVSDWMGRTVRDAAEQSFTPNEEAKQVLLDALSPQKGTAAGKTGSCQVCGAPSSQRCGRCKAASYCSHECQRR
ncbi:ankyrin repeat-containing protein [Acanthamoeba castellanii str. Neff]|uniref:Ankyrin repeat-containing protein n=1 Tax=Acanthamoeba castellanii (strain ATCC 30010 / Neff) TaxID=1257118 RepID=L8GP27_ACACF|nr:ankyrin repeat-containing protein [Acanthamoeba castellanii str. Neff]ELR14632.1 ankyrin repeat-containing protein [Acanthamoeba castellanii str. Neff]